MARGLEGAATKKFLLPKTMSLANGECDCLHAVNIEVDHESDRDGDLRQERRP